MFTELYLKTTDPTTKWTDLFQPKWFPLWIFSILYHLFLYTIFANLVSFVFLGRSLSMNINKRLIFCLLIILLFGYFGRMHYVKDIYKGYHYDKEKAKLHIDKFFISWVFLG